MDFIILEKTKAMEKIGFIDDYLLSIKPIERSLKMNVGYEVSLEEFREFLSNTVLEFTKEDNKKLHYAIDLLKLKLIDFHIINPEFIYLVKTNGKDEWNSAYTRGNIIFLPEKKLINYKQEELFELLAHEFFHVYSRFNRDKREKLYELLDFKFIQESPVPVNIKNRCLVNPDAMQEVYTEITENNTSVKAIPLIMIKYDNINTSIDILNSIKVKLYIINNNSLIDAKESIEYTQKIGINTDNFQHPDETLAENFTFLLSSKSVVNNEFLLKIKEIILS